MIEPGRTLGDYRIVRLLGGGGMAAVYLAERSGPEGFTKSVALKVIRPELAGDPRFRTMFVEEAKIAQALAHGNVVQIFEMGDAEEHYFIAMEHVAGVSLQALLVKLERLPLDLALYIVRCLCRALHHAHTRTDRDGNPLHIVHRDVSPHNVLLAEDGQVKLADFGISRARTRLSVTSPGTIKGKSGYLSPEQIEESESVDHRSDIFALGIVAYQMVTGLNPLAAPTLEASFRRTLLGEIPRPSDRVPELEGEVERILMRALARRPEDRYDSAQLMLGELEQVRLARKDTTDAPELAALLKTHGEPALPRLLDGALAQVLDGEPARDLTRPAATAAASEPRPPRSSARLLRRLAVLATLAAVAIAGAHALRRAFDAPERKDRPVARAAPGRAAAPARDREGPTRPVERAADRGVPTVLPDRDRRRLPQQTGQLWINLVPWARVSIDGQPVGDTPLRRVLPAGPHRVLLHNPAMNLRRELVVVVRPAQLVRVEQW